MIVYGTAELDGLRLDAWLGEDTGEVTDSDRRFLTGLLDLVSRYDTARSLGQPPPLAYKTLSTASYRSSSMSGRDYGGLDVGVAEQPLNLVTGHAVAQESRHSVRRQFCDLSEAFTWDPRFDEYEVPTSHQPSVKHPGGRSAPGLPR